MMENTKETISEIDVEENDRPTFKSAMQTLIQQQLNLLEEYDKAQKHSMQNIPSQPILCKLLHPNAKLPQKATPGSAGYDLHAVEETVLHPGKYKAVKTGIMIQCPPNYYGKISGRSGLAFNENIFVFEGTLDADYLKEISILLKNDSKSTKTIYMGDKIAQIVFIKIHEHFSLQESFLLKKSKRGGFGSTGK